MEITSINNNVTIESITSGSVEIVSNNESVDITLIAENISTETTISSATTDVSIIDIGVQGIPGARGLQGNVGPALVYADLTVSQKQEVINQLDNTIGNTSYTNVFLASLLG